MRWIGIYIDVRPKLPNQGSYKSWWANELHPTKRGFKVVTDMIADSLDQL